VLHRQQGLAHGDFLDQVDEAAGLGAAHAGRGFVQQDDVGAAGNRDADFQRALLGIGQVGGQHVALFVELDHGHQLLGALVGVVQVGQEAEEGVLVAQAPQHAAAQVFKHAELGEDVGDLEAARQGPAG
jgi:hypothetical protein